MTPNEEGLPMIPIEEEDAIKRILRHHGADVDRGLVDDLGTLVEWVREIERDKFKLARHHPPPLISLLSGMGIYGNDYVNKVSFQEGS